MAEAECDDLEGQVEIFEWTFTFFKSMAVRSAIMLGIPDAIAQKAPELASLDEIATTVHAKNKVYLFRLMRFLVHHKVFLEERNEQGSKYGLTRASKWLVKQGNGTNCLAPWIVLQCSEVLVSPWHRLHESILKEAVPFGPQFPFERTHSKNLFDYTRDSEEFNDFFNQGMTCGYTISTGALLQHYHGFEGISTVVDVGGGVGHLVASIVEKYPSIKGINFDLPYVVETAPSFPGVEQVAGDMFKEIPAADAAVIKWVLHDWSDEKCVQILSNCHAALPRGGKVMILEAVIEDDVDDTPTRYRGLNLAYDVLMMVATPGGEERSEAQWRRLLAESGFASMRVHKIPTLFSVVEGLKA